MCSRMFSRALGFPLGANSNSSPAVTAKTVSQAGQMVPGAGGDGGLGGWGINPLQLRTAEPEKGVRVGGPGKEKSGESAGARSGKAL